MMDALAVVRSVYAVAMRDDTWQTLGFERRPRGGTFFKRFRPRWRVALEDTAFQELVALLTAACVKADLPVAARLDELVVVLISGRGSDPLWTAFGYVSSADGQRRLHDACSAYANATVEDWAALLITRLGVPDVPDQTLAAALMVGGVRTARMADALRVRMSQSSGQA